MKNLSSLFLLFVFACPYQLWANCGGTPSGDACATAKTLDNCPAQSFSENPGNVCTQSVVNWTPSGGGTGVASLGNDIFYEVTATEDPLATPGVGPYSIEVTISEHAADVQVFFLGATCGTTYETYELIPASICQETVSFSVPNTGTYYVAIVSTGTFDVRFGGLTGSSTGSNPACPEGQLEFDDMMPSCSGTPFYPSARHFELCLNGSVVPTGQVITFNLAPATNQLCIRTVFKNTTGAENFNVVDFNFGPALTATPTTVACSGATVINPYDTQAAQQGGSGNWQVTDFTNPISTVGIPSGVTVTNRISWIFDNASGRGDIDNSACNDNYACYDYEFCFEIEATNNDPDDTNVVGVFYPDDYNQAASEPVTYGCTNQMCLCPTEAECVALAYGNRNNNPLSIQFNDPAQLPVELLSFTANATPKGHLLRWETASEENNSHFEIQHSVDGERFEVIGEVQGNGNATDRIAYEFLHEGEWFGTHYYRLKQVDFDGVYEYSQVLSIEGLLDEPTKPQIYPTAAKDELNISIEEGGLLKGTYYLIYDNLGQLVKQGRCGASSHEVLDISQLSQGQYYIQLLKENELLETSRFLKL